MKSKPCQFKVFFEEGNFHHVSVLVHRSKSALNARGAKLGMKSGPYCGFCAPHSSYGAEFPIATIHLSSDNLTIDTIAHECSHAAFFRCEHFGHYKNSSAFQERLATDTGILTEAIITKLRRLHSKFQKEPAISLNKA